MKPTIGASLFTLGLAACSAAQYPTRTNATNPSGNDGVNLDQIAVRVVPKVSLFDLDSPEFRVTGVRAGLQDFLLGDTPAITYNLPEKADYIEILRCKSDTILKGTFDDLTDVDLGSPGLDGEARAFQHNDFWSAAATQTIQCQLVTTGFSGKAFLDVHIPSGSYRYLVRACVSEERLTDTEYGPNRSCSRQVALSPLLSDFHNDRDERQKTALSAIQRFRDRVDGLGRELHYLTVEFNNAYAKCQTDEKDRQMRVKRKEILGKILGIGISLGLELSLPETGLGAVEAGEKTWRDLWQETWEKKDAIAATGGQVGTALLWLFSSTRDFPKSCTAAKEIAMKAETKTTELKNVHLELAQALDLARDTQGKE